METNVERLDAAAVCASRRRRARTMFDDRAVNKLDSMFAVDQYPDITTREELAEELQVPEARIQTWFQNKRSRTKRNVRNIHVSSPGSDCGRQLKENGPHGQTESVSPVCRPVARIRPKTEAGILCESSLANGQLRGPIRSQVKPVFRPELRSEIGEIDAKCKLSMNFERQMNAQPDVILSQPCSFSYTPVFNFSDGRYYFQPVPNMMHQPLTTMATINKQAIISPQAGSVASGYPLINALPNVQGSRTQMATLSPIIKHETCVSLTQTMEQNTFDSDSGGEELSAKEKLSSVAWMATSHFSEKLNRSRHSADLRDDGVEDIDVC